MNQSPPPKRPRRWRMQYSLRFFLLAFTAFAIGFPIWYRWPYQSETVQRDATGAVVARRIITWQRQWGGERLQHGPERLILGDATFTPTYVRGLRHGPHSEIEPQWRLR